ncbi:MAG TPA: ATP-binding protein [Urbifossiella sp.]|nr:ATP-binding protein [Urbifossiella sp.]
MIADLATLQAELANGTLLEHRHTNVELKASWQQDVGKKISANANKPGPEPTWVVIGVDTNGKVTGKDETWLRKTEEEVSGHLNQYLDPLQTCGRIETFKASSGWVLVIPIKSPGAVVYWNHSAYKSAGTTIAVMEPDEIMAKTVSLPGLHDYSAQPCPPCEYDHGLVSQFAKLVEGIRPESHFAGLSNLGTCDAILDRLKIRDRNVARILFGDCSCRVVYYDAKGEPAKQDRIRGLFRVLTPEFQGTIQEWTAQQVGQSGKPYPE